MKLNKPQVTESHSELESYVASMLTEQVIGNVSSVSKVTPLRQTPIKSVKTKAVVPERSEKTNRKELLDKESVKKESKSKDSAKISNSSSLNNQSSHRASEDKLSVKKPKVRPEVENSLIDNNQSRTSSMGVSSRFIEKSIEEEILVNHEQSTNTIQVQSDSKELSSAANQNKDDPLGVLHRAQVAKELKAYTESEFSDEKVEDPRLKNVEVLLSRIALASTPVKEVKAASKKKTDSKQNSEALIDESQGVSIEAAEATFIHRENEPLKDSLGSVFQTLVFEVNNLPLAVPLVKLGGIVNLNQAQITPLVGTPNWFLGLVANERGNLMVVDTQRFLMPEKKVVASIDYQYLIVLDDSRWALACHSVGDAKNLTPDDVRWSSRSSKRPWFAGMVVEYMSALVEVDQLINMLAKEIVD